MSERMIRQATPDDRTAILELNTRAFGQPDEANIITKLEKDGDILVELVAHEGDQILGHILFYPIGVFGKLGAIGLGPMCVDPWVQREGIGSSLVTQGLNLVREQGAPLVFVLGHKEYYPRFGFSEEATAEFQTPLKGPHFMAIRFRFGPPMSGRLVFPAAFGIADLA
ncbi:MAG: N-acetyltransferase [Hyphomonadaceae bacterium]|nr:N-acetyltransferase [Hyphomonadaceae bacterium]